MADIVKRMPERTGYEVTALAYGAMVKVAIRLHPELVARRHREVEKFCALLPETYYVGEIGLDGSRSHGDRRTSRRSRKQALYALERQ